MRELQVGAKVGLQTDKDAGCRIVLGKGLLGDRYVLSPTSHNDGVNLSIFASNEVVAQAKQMGFTTGIVSENKNIIEDLKFGDLVSYKGDTEQLALDIFCNKFICNINSDNVIKMPNTIINDKGIFLIEVSVSPYKTGYPCSYFSLDKFEFNKDISEKCKLHNIKHVSTSNCYDIQRTEVRQLKKEETLDDILTALYDGYKAKADTTDLLTKYSKITGKRCPGFMG